MKTAVSLSRTRVGLHLSRRKECASAERRRGATRTSWSGHTRNADRETQGPKGSFPRAGMMLVGRLGMVQTCSCVEIGERSEGRISSAHYDFLTWLVVAYRPESRNCRHSTNRSVVRQRMYVPRPNAGFWRWHAGMLSSESRTLTRARSGAGMVLDRSTAGFISPFMRGGTEFLWLWTRERSDSWSGGESSGQRAVEVFVLVRDKHNSKEQHKVAQWQEFEMLALHRCAESCYCTHYCTHRTNSNVALPMLTACMRNMQHRSFGSLLALLHSRPRAPLPTGGQPTLRVPTSRRHAMHSNAEQAQWWTRAAWRWALRAGFPVLGRSAGMAC